MVDAVIEEPQHSEIFLPKNGTVLPPIVARIYNSVFVFDLSSSEHSVSMSRQPSPTCAVIGSVCTVGGVRPTVRRPTAAQNDALIAVGVLQ